MNDISPRLDQHQHQHEDQNEDQNEDHDEDRNEDHDEDGTDLCYSEIHHRTFLVSLPVPKAFMLMLLNNRAGIDMMKVSNIKYLTQDSI